ncbi:MAG: hypothetical protein NTV30_11335, partial [Chloroflexi bacterium]|nr:hypothetical protein [Chloroflexota bacterium]
MEEKTQKEQEMYSSQNSDEDKLRIKEMENTLEKQNKTIDSLNDQIVSAVNKYRTAVLTGYEEIPGEMVTGNTIEEIDSSLARAKSMVE